MDREFLIRLERLFTDFSGVGGVHLCIKTLLFNALVLTLQQAFHLG